MYSDAQCNKCASRAAAATLPTSVHCTLYESLEPYICTAKLGSLANVSDIKCKLNNIDKTKQIRHTKTRMH